MPLPNADFMSGFRYHILIDNEPGACFQECSDLTAAGRIILSRGAFVTQAFFDWVMQHSAARTLTVVLHNSRQEQPVTNWELGGVRVVKVTATTFTGKGFPFRVEELELSVESIATGEKL